MAGQVDRFKVGLFVVASFLIGAAMLIWLGATHFFSSSRGFVAYFNETVQGLESDSPVKFRGVTVGRVRAIRMAPDKRLVEVVMNLSDTFEVTDDLGVKIGYLGLTGQKYLEMDRFSPAQRRSPEPLDFKPPHPVITSYPSEIREFGNALDSLFQKVNAIDVQRISTNMLSVSARLDKILGDPKMDNVGADAAEAVAEIRTVARKLNEELERLQAARRMGKVLDNSAEFLQEITKTARSTDKLVYRTDHNINRLSGKIERVADNLVELLTILRKKPSLLLYGEQEEKPGRRR